MYGIKCINFTWFRSYLTSRNGIFQWTIYRLETDTRNSRCRVPQSSILSPLFFSLYDNYLHSSSAFDPKIFADGANLVFEDKDLKTFFYLVIQKLQKVNE